MPNYPCDMHCHTTRSDGNDTPLELIAHAVDADMQAIAITDHDIDPPQTVTLPDDAVCDIVRYAAEQGITLVLGYEFSCDKFVDDVHICGYGMDWAHPDLQAEIDAAKQSKSKGYRQLCERLCDAEMPVDWDADILTYRDSGGTQCTRQDDEVQRKHVFEAMAALGHCDSWSDAKILVRDNPSLNVRRRKIEAVDAVELIHRCGGVGVLAHPYLIDETVLSAPAAGDPISRTDYINRLFDAGLDGIEARYTYNKTTYKGDMTPEQIEQEVRTLFGASARIISGGSDYHADHKKASKKVREMGERGLTEHEFQNAFGSLVSQ